jgi:hypothetical protein
MDDLGQQCVMRLKRDRNIAPTIADRRLLARTVLTVGRDFPIVAFQWSDTHGHMAVASDPAVAAEAARRIESALKQVLRLTVPFAPVDLTPIRDVWHLKNVVRYIYTQGSHHGYRDDPFREGSSLPDTLGWRTLGVQTARTLRVHQPRVTRVGLLTMVDLVDTDAPVRWDGDWCDAVAAAACRPDGHGKHRDTFVARAAVVGLAEGAFTRADVCDRLRISARAHGRLLEVEPPAGVIRAVRQQLVLRSPTFVRSAKEAAELAAAAAAAVANAAPDGPPQAEPKAEWRFLEP